MSNESATQWRNAFYALFTVMQALGLGLLFYMINRMDAQAQANVQTNIRMGEMDTRLSAQVSKLDGKVEAIRDRMYTTP